MTTWNGNHYWFSSDGRHAVAYRVHSGVALTTCDPIGDRDTLLAAIDEFAAYCAENGWTPCLYSVGEPTAVIAREHGWTCLQVAEETVIRLDGLAFTGKKFQDVRTALNRARKDGVTAEWTSMHDAPLAVTEQIVAISEEWVADKGLPEMGFTLGGLEELHDPEVRLLLAIDDDRHVHAVTSWMPVHRDGVLVALTLDFMRRRSDGFRPSMEFLIASAALSAQEKGLEYLSLSGGAPPGRRRPAGLGGPDRARHPAGDARTHPRTGLRVPVAARVQVQVPAGVPAVYMVFPDPPAALPAIGVAVGHAYLRCVARTGATPAGPVAAEVRTIRTSVLRPS